MSDRPRVLVTRSPKQSSALADRLRELGAEPILIPTIEIVDPSSFVALDSALANLLAFDWLLFTSANAVEAMQARLAFLAAGMQTSPVISPGKPRPRLAAIGPATARALQQFGLPPDLLPPQAVAESMAQALLPHARHPDSSPAKFLLVRAEDAREHLPENLRAAGADVTVAPAYRTVVPAAFIPRIRELFGLSNAPHTARLDAITFTSASTVRNLFTMLEAAGTTFPPQVIRASIGPITSAALADAGFPAHLEARQTTVDSLAADVVKYLAVSQRR